MKILFDSLKVTGIVLVVLAVFVGLSLISTRNSLGYWFVLSAIFLPVTFLKSWGFRWWCIGALVASASLTFSPIDFCVRRGEFGLRILPTSRGIVSRPGTISYGCVARNPPKHAMVLFL